MNLVMYNIFTLKLLFVARKIKHTTNIPIEKLRFNDLLNSKTKKLTMNSEKKKCLFKHTLSDVILKCIIYLTLFLVHSLQANGQWIYIYQER